MVLSSKHLNLKSSNGLLCLFVNNSEVLATKRENVRNEKKGLTSETAAKNCFKETKKLSKAEEYQKYMEQKRCIEIVKYTCAILMVLVLFINWWFFGYRVFYAFGVCGLIYFFIVRAAEKIDFSKL